jgi:hypothetical protein
MNKIVRYVGIVVVAIGFLGLAHNNATQGLAEADSIKIYWGTCSIPNGSVCAKCTAPTSCTPLGGAVGGVNGCDSNMGITRGTSCPTIFGTCVWYYSRCGFVEYAVCVVDPITFLWVPACELTTDVNDTCEGC